MKKRLLRRIALLLIFALSLMTVSALAAGDGNSYTFFILADGEKDTYAPTGSTVSVQLLLTNQTVSGQYDLYTMQDYITFDPTFFELVDGSIEVLKGKGVSANGMSFRMQKPDDLIYISRASTNPTTVEKQSVLMTFQLKVLATEGTGTIGHDTYFVSKELVKSNSVAEDATVTVGIREYTIKTSSNTGGTVTGPEKVQKGQSATYSITAKSGYKIKDVLVDGVSVGAVSGYTFDNVDKDHTVEAIFETKSGGGGGGGSTGNTTKSLTVPVSGNNNRVNVSVTVSGSTATVKEIADTELSKVLGGEVVEINLTELNKKIDTTVIPTATVKKISDKGGMSVKLPDAIVTFDKKAMETIASKATGDTVELVVENIERATLNANQKKAVESLNTALIIDAYLVSNGKRLCTADIGGFNGGKAMIFLPCAIKSGYAQSDYTVYCIGEDGKLEKLDANYDAGAKGFTFDVDCFSKCVIAYDGKSADENVMPFTDVPKDEYFYNAVEWAVKNGITKGTSATLFSPYVPITRAEVVTFLWRTAGCPKPMGNASKFVDVEVGSYYEEAVAWAIEQVVTKGTSETTFSPDMICTRAHIVTFIARFAGIEDADTESVFSDVNSTDYFAAAVKWAKDNGITVGTSPTTFSPDEDCTRAQVVTFLYRWKNK